MKCLLIILVLTLIINENYGHSIKKRVNHRSVINDKYMHPDIEYSPVSAKLNTKVDDSEYWLTNAKSFVDSQIEKVENKKTAKNIILFLGDGMSIPTLAATRVYLGGEKEFLSFEKFSNIGMSKTYCVDYQTADSACTATAYLTGVKGNYGTTGVNGKVERYNCETGLDPANHVDSIAKWAINSGKVAGLVTTTRVTHASPSGVYAHIANRDWESDSDVNQDCESAVVKPDDIANQLIHGEVGKQLKVILGGGRREFLDKTLQDDENSYGDRSDGRNLIDEWKTLREEEDVNGSYVWNKQDLLAINTTTTDYLLGLFETSHCLYNLEAIDKNVQHLEPTLSEMTEKAIEILSKNEKGFFLFVEGGLIDWAHHDSQARIAIDETAEFAKAIQMARNKLSEDDTLIVVTSDHAHTLSVSGYSTLGSDIFGTTGILANDGMPLMTLSYANGMGNYVHYNNETFARDNVSDMDTERYDFMFPGTVAKDSESHGGDDVGVFASGPWSHLFTGSYEQSTIPHMMAYASCIGNGLTAC